MAQAVQAHDATSSSTSRSRYVYDVFLNHRGPDVKKGLASHIYHRLKAHGLTVFLDQRELEEGEHMTPQIEGAIRTASVHVAIFSPQYADSPWCLKELVLMLKPGSTTIPVFYNVHPSELRWTGGGDGLYARALGVLAKKRTFNSDQPRYDSNTIQNWRKALFDVAEISGFELKECNSDEGQLVDEVVKQVLKKVTKPPLNVAKYPTGLNEKVKDLEMTVSLQQKSGKATVVGIVGLGGIGKTTLAKEFFNRHISDYDRSCFVFDVRENKNSLKSLQTILKDLARSNEQINSVAQGTEKLKQNLSSSHKALMVLDDVDHIEQLDALFSPVRDTIHSNSLILVTSRKKDVLISSDIPESSIYTLTGLNRQHSQGLFCSHAFGQSHPVVGFDKVVEEFLDRCCGLPLSLKVIGALLRGKRDLKEWKAQLRKIYKILPDDIQSTLKISYDSLDENEKQIFLDISCFFLGEDRDTAIRIWDGSGWEGLLGLRTLENRCLVEVDRENCIGMHDHLRDLGRDLAEKEPSERPLRLWRLTDNLIHKVSSQSPVRGISMFPGNGPQESFHNLAELACSNLHANTSRLQLLRTEGSGVERIISVTQPPQLVWLHWYFCPFPSLPSWISLKSLRVLYIKGTELKTLWQHESQAPLELRELNVDAPLLNLPKSVGKLKHLEKFVLHGSYLKALPDQFCHMHSLECVELENCKELTLLPNAVGNLTNLRSLVLSGCSLLQMLPDSVGNLTNLERLRLWYCTDLQLLPDSVGNLTNLKSLDLYQCSALQMLPDSVENLTNLERLRLWYCTDLQLLPNSVGNLTNLKTLELYECSALQMLPDSVGNLTNLESLWLWCCTDLQLLPDSVGNLTNLKNLNLCQCSALQMLPDSVGNLTNLETLELNDCSALQMLPDSVGNLTNLEILKLNHCSALQMLPDSVGNLTNLRSLDLSDCSALQMLPDSVGNLTNLRSLGLSVCSALQMLPDSVGNLTNLEILKLNYCSALQMLPDSVGNLTNLKRLKLWRSPALQMLLPDSVGNLTNLKIRP